MKSRAEHRATLAKLLNLASRPGTKAEGAAAWTKAKAYAERHGFAIRIKQPVTKAARATFRADVGYCAECGQGFVTAWTGRPRVYCGGACRVRAFRRRNR